MKPTPTIIETVLALKREELALFAAMLQRPPSTIRALSLDPLEWIKHLSMLSSVQAHGDVMGPLYRELASHRGTRHNGKESASDNVTEGNTEEGQ